MIVRMERSEQINEVPIVFSNQDVFGTFWKALSLNHTG